jgi:hypothetical protein
MLLPHETDNTVGQLPIFFGGFKLRITFTRVRFVPGVLNPWSAGRIGSPMYFVQAVYIIICNTVSTSMLTNKYLISENMFWSCGQYLAVPVAVSNCSA